MVNKQQVLMGLYLSNVQSLISEHFRDDMEAIRAFDVLYAKIITKMDTKTYENFISNVQSLKRV